MTFEEWWTLDKQIRAIAAPESTAKSAWDAATAAERQRCREIVDERGRYADIAEMLDQIGEGT